MAMHTTVSSNPLYGNNYYGLPNLKYTTWDGTGLTISWTPYMGSCIIRFITPDFVGSSEFLTLALTLSYCEKDFDVRCALCESDSNWKKYRTNQPSQNFQVTDENQIATGSQSCTAWNVNDPYNHNGLYKDWQITLLTRLLKPNTTYYLFLWGCPSDPPSSDMANQTTFLFPTNKAAITIGYNDGLIFIDNGSVFGSYQCYIDNGTSWDLMIPHIDNGSGWDMYT